MQCLSNAYFFLEFVDFQQCDKIIKHIGYANHVRRRHLCNPYEQNGTNSADEAPDFLLSPPYVSTRKSSSISTANSPFYTSEKRDDLLLVLKRARVPLMTKTIQVSIVLMVYNFIVLGRKQQPKGITR